MNTGGRRGPLGPLLCGLASCAFLVAALSLSLSAGSTHSPVDTAKVTTITHAVATAHLVARPANPDHDAVPLSVLVLTVGLGFVLIRRRRPAPLPAQSGRRPSGRAPPGPIAHL